MAKFSRLENIVGKGENAGFHHFLLFHNVAKMLFSQGPSKSGLRGKGLNAFTIMRKNFLRALSGNKTVFCAGSAVFHLFNGNSSQIHVSWTT